MWHFPAFSPLVTAAVALPLICTGGGKSIGVASRFTNYWQKADTKCLIGPTPGPINANNSKLKLSGSCGWFEKIFVVSGKSSPVRRLSLECIRSHKTWNNIRGKGIIFFSVVSLKIHWKIHIMQEGWENPEMLALVYWPVIPRRCLHNQAVACSCK